MNKRWVWTILIISALSLAACQTTPTETPAATVSSESGQSVIVQGRVEPVRSIDLAFSVNGRVAEVFATEGAMVEAGQVIARLSGGEKTLAELAAAELDLHTAEQELKDLRENAALALAEATMKLAEAEKELDKANSQRLSREYRIGSDEQLDIANADIIVAREDVRLAEDAYNSLSGLGETDKLRAGALSALAAARQRLDRAEANYDYLLSKPNLLQVNIAQARVDLAQANVDTAKAQVAALSAGPDADLVAAVEIRMETAESVKKAALAAIDALELRAPLTGSLVEVDLQPGQFVSAGQLVGAIADLSAWQVKTDDLTELEVTRVFAGENARLILDALPGNEMNAEVVHIAERFEEKRGDVTYTVTLAIKDPVEALRWGMTGQINFMESK
jgi:multidrug resistance efflux pump